MPSRQDAAIISPSLSTRINSKTLLTGFSLRTNPPHSQKFNPGTLYPLFTLTMILSLTSGIFVQKRKDCWHKSCGLRQELVLSSII
jgi:hypothetical protein